MPALLPVSGRAVLRSLTPWLPDEDAARIAANDSRVAFRRYDWGPSCAID